MIRRIFNIAWKELLHLRKDRVMIPFFILGGILELSLIAWATNQPIDDLNMAVVDLDGSQQSAALIKALDDTDTLTLQHEVESLEEVYDLMDNVSTVIDRNNGLVQRGSNEPKVKRQVPCLDKSNGKALPSSD